MPSSRRVGRCVVYGHRLPLHGGRRQARDRAKGGSDLYELGTLARIQLEMSCETSASSTSDASPQAPLAPLHCLGG